MADENYVLGADVVKSEGQDLQNLAAAIKNQAKQNPPIGEAPKVEVGKEEDKKEGEQPEEKKEIQVKSEIEIQQEEADKETERLKAGTDKLKNKGKKKEKIVAKDKEGKEVTIPNFEENEISDFLTEIGEEPRQKETPAKEEKQKAGKEKSEFKIPKDVQAKLDRLAFLEKVTESPVYAFAEKLVSEGKGLKDAVKEFDLTDYDSISNKDVYEIDLKSKGLEGEELTEAIEEFESKKSYEQKIITNPIRAQLKKSADEKNKSLSRPQLSEQDIIEQKRFQKAAIEDGMSRLDEMLEEASTKGIKGLGWKPKEKELQMIKEYAGNNTVISPDGKSYDIEASFERAVWLNPDIRKKALKYAHDVGRFVGFEDFIKDRVRIDKNEFVQGDEGGKSKYVFGANVVKPENGKN